MISETIKASNAIKKVPSECGNTETFIIHIYVIQSTIIEGTRMQD
ncbi:hypothetical protein [Gracilibacillus kekensis]|nr:hypothetical protein [Gracilibacillus kekensis]